jgi:hypothetical protein
MGSILMNRGDRFSWQGDAHPTQATSMIAFSNYAFVFNNNDNLLDTFNSAVEAHIDVHHRLDLVMSLSEKDMVGYKDTTVSVLNFLARKQLQ